MTKPKVTTMTRAEYAAARGVSRARVSQLAAEGKLALTLDDRVDVAQTDALLALKTDSRGGSNRGGREAAELKQAARERITAKTRREEAQASLAELQLARERAELMVASEVVDFLASALTDLRTYLEALPAQIAPQLIGSDEERIHALLAEHIEMALTELSHKFTQLGNQANTTQNRSR